MIYVKYICDNCGEECDPEGMVTIGIVAKRGVGRTLEGCPTMKTVDWCRTCSGYKGIDLYGPEPEIHALSPTIESLIKDLIYKVISEREVK